MLDTEIDTTWREGEKSRGWKSHVVMFVSHYTVTHITASFTVMSFIGWVPDKIPWPAVSLLFVNPRDYLCDTITTTTCQGVRRGGDNDMPTQLTLVFESVTNEHCKDIRKDQRS
ncbi:predicted protein [Lichtheimia corymbifera JMRC:FSU:9682]|uniref:Uncharacterized protein n=1 Tax=Lichtheimia corymbifera JMRC:FSU:9682 TaxID=1263082 RepID=A0A068SA69_9FUNG|nr:predicted protein [Lichtheimia corymbifera JMRC:FSU:9682]